MPIKNPELLVALTHNTLIARTEGGGAIAALDELIKVDRTNADAFRKAILDKKDFWHGFQGLNIDLLVDKAEDVAFLDPTGGLFGAAQTFETLHKHAVQRRVEAGLKKHGNTIPDDFLRELIDGNPTQVRAKLATVPGAFGNLAGLTPPAWDTTTEDFLTNNAVLAIQTQAKEQFLLNKINATVASKAEVEALIALAAAGHEGNFRAGLQAAPWNIPPATKLNLACANFTPKVQKAALEKGLELSIKAIAPGMGAVGADAILTTLNETPDNFKRDFLAPYAGEALLDAPAVNKAKGQLGERFLTTRLSQLGAPRLGDLATIAAQGNVADLVRVLKTHNDLAGGAPNDGNNFVAHAVTTASLPALRETAGLQALKLKIAECDDPDALDALIDATNKEQLKAVLASKTSLGFTTSPGFHEAFNNLRSTDEIIAAAHVQKRLLTASTAQLKDLAKIDLAGTYANTQAYFTQNLTAPLLGKVTAYLTQERIKEIREKALVDYIKTPLATMDTVALNNLARAGGYQAVLAGVRILMGGQEADDLVNNPVPHDSGVSQQVCAHAAAEQVYRAGVAFVNLSGGDYTTLVGYINDVAANAPQGDQRALIAVLPPKEKQALQERMVTDLVSRFPPANVAHPKVQLDALAIAKNEVEFRQALTAMGIIGPGQAWINDASRARVQKAACDKALTFQIAGNAQYGLVAHPQLLALVKQLPLKKQQALLTKPEVMAALLNVQVEHGRESEAEAAVRDILGLNRRSPIDVKPFVQENKNLGHIRQIANPQIAQILAQQSPPLAIDPGKILQINALLHANLGADNVRGIFDNNGGAASNYVHTVNAIQNIVGVVPPSFFTDFGLNAPGTNFANGGDAIRGQMEQQRTLNAAMITKARGLDVNAPEYGLVTFCAALSKTGNLTNVHYDELRDDIKAASSIDDFIQKATTRGTYSTVLDATFLKTQLTPETFKLLKREQTRNHLLDTTNYNVAGLGPQPDPNSLPGKKAELKTMTDLFAQMKKVNNKVISQLKRVGGMEAIDWFNPAFHAAAKQNADKLGPELNSFAEACDVFVSQLAYQKKAIQEQLDSLPRADQLERLPNPNQPGVIQQKKDIEAYRKELTGKLNEVSTELAHYQKVQKVLRGDPDSPNHLMQQGLVKVVAQAKEGKKDIKFRFDSELEPDCPADKRADFFKPDWRGKRTVPPGVSTVSSAGGRNPNHYYAVNAVPEGMIRPHRISYGVNTTADPNARITGGFLEERGPVRPTPAKDGSTNYLPSLKITINAFPEASGVPPTSPKALQDARVNYSMAVACQTLAGLHEPPSKDNPIVLNGSNEEELRYLWTAFITMGKIGPQPFDASAIKVVTPAFNPENEKGRVYGLANNSLYETAFKGSPGVRNAETFFQEAAGHKAGNKKGRQQTEQDLSKLSQLFKSDFQGVVGAVKAVNDATPSVVKSPTLGGSGDED